MTLGPYQLNSIVTGDARVLAESIPDSSVDLIITDPIYWQIEDYGWLAETAARVLKPRKSVLAFCGHSYEIPAGAMMLPHLTPGPVLEHYIAGAIGRLFSHSLQCNLIPCLWFSKGLPDNDWMFVQQLSIPKGDRGHRWGKAELMIANRMMSFTQSNDLIVDFFCGGGTVPSVAKMLGRNYWACEIDSETAEKARQRVELTQMPLFIMPQPEQVPLFAEVT